MPVSSSADPRTHTPFGISEGRVFLNEQRVLRCTPLNKCQTVTHFIARNVADSHVTLHVGVLTHPHCTDARNVPGFREQLVLTQLERLGWEKSRTRKDNRDSIHLLPWPQTQC